jgi:hypothetical protein
LDNHSAHISKRDAWLPSDQAAALGLRTHTDTRLVAESDRESIPQDDSHAAARNPLASKQERIDRIHPYFEEINAARVVCRWKYKMDEVLIV